MANNQIVISRIQHRRGLKENLPQPLLPGELALTVDTGELWIGNNLSQPPFGVRTYSEGFSSSAESIVDTQVASAKFELQLSVGDFDSLVEYLTDAPTPAVVLTEDDILWDTVAAVFVKCDTSVDSANTITNVLAAIYNSAVGTFDLENSGPLGTINQPWVSLNDGNPTTVEFINPNIIQRDLGDWANDNFYVGQRVHVTGSASNDGIYVVTDIPSATDLEVGVYEPDTPTVPSAAALVNEGPSLITAVIVRGERDPLLANAFDLDGVFQFTSVFATPNSQQGANAAILINEINTSALVTTFGNLQIPTSGIGVGALSFRDITIENTDSGFTWSGTGSASADSGADQLTIVAGTDIALSVDASLDAIRISSDIQLNTDNIYTDFTPGEEQFTLTANTVAFTDTGLSYDLSESNVIFIEYSLSISGGTPSATNYTVAGRLRIVGDPNVDTGEATLVDEQTEVRDPALVGDINFQAQYNAGSVDLQYTNTFNAAATLRVLARRWLAY